MRLFIGSLLVFGSASLTYPEIPPQGKSPFNRGPVWKRHTIDVSAPGADGARLLDANGDGLLDVATGFEEGGQVRIMLHPGKEKVRKLWPSVMVGKVRSPEDAVFVDLDGDGVMDVVSSCEGGERAVFAHWGPKDKTQYLDPNAWKTQAFPAVKKMTQWMFAEPFQIDGKNGVDVVVGGKNKNGQIGWLQAPANPRDIKAWKYHKLRDAGWIMSLVKADIDGDKDLDVLVTDRYKKLRGCFWLENPGPGPDQMKPWKEHAVGAMGEEAMLLDYADLDGDGLKDVIVPMKNRKLYFFRRKPGKTVAWEKHEIPYPPNTGSGKAVTVGDINLDGKMDLVVASANANKGSGIVWMSYRGSATSGNWDVHEISGLLGIKFDLCPLADLDGDGDLDVINTDERAKGGGLGTVWYENPVR